MLLKLLKIKHLAFFCIPAFHETFLTLIYLFLGYSKIGEKARYMHILLDFSFVSSIHCVVTKGNAMKTAKVYMVRNPSDIKKVRDLCQHYTNQTEEVVIVETIHLSPVCYRPMDDYIFLSGKGGYDDNNHCQVIELKCAGKSTLYVDPSGSSYCRYMGIADV